MNIYNALIYKKLYGGGGGGEIEVESLTATENKTYNAGEGKAYNPVVVAVPEPTLISKNITANGNYSASADNADGYSSVSVNVPLPSNAYLLKSIENVNIATFTDGTDNYLKSLAVAIEPLQDLHGYDSPWVGGAGKNKLFMTVDDIKALNTSGTWSGNTYTLNNVAFTIMTDENNNITRFNVNGIASATMVFTCGSGLLPSNTYIGNGCPSGGSSSTYRLQFSVSGVSGSYIDTGSGAQFTSDAITTCNIFIANGFNAQNMKFYPMIRLASVADATFAPYSNECLISGWDEVNVGVEGGQNLYNDGIVWKNNYYINASGDETQSNNYKYTQTFIEVEPSTTYSIQADIIALTDLAITVPYYSEQQSFISRDLVINVDIGTHTYKADFTTPSNCKYIRISVPTDTTNIVIYKKKTYTIDLDGTRYGGTLDVVNGVLTLTHGYIASYNGETLPSTWISDRDVYVEGTTPTIGAEVCYKLATPQTIQLTPTIIKSLQGDNNFFASTGEIELLQYWGKEVTS